MLENYFRVALRSLRQKVGYTIINVVGLAIGLGCFILVISFNRKELSYDQSFPNADRIFRLTTYLDVNGLPNHYPLTHFPAPADLMAEYPEVERCLRMYTPTLFGGNPPKIKKDDRVFSEGRFFITDSTFFDFFPFEFQSGDRQTALLTPGSVVVTEEIAVKYFGSTDPIGQTLSYNDSLQLTVTGVIKKPEFNTHLQFDFLANARRIIRASIPPDIDLEHAYIGMWYYGYIKLRTKQDAVALQGKLPDFSNRHYTQRYKDNNGKLELQHVSDIHLRSNDMVAGDISTPGNFRYVQILGIVGVCVLVVACINFINMATARYLTRTKEVGVRKVVGAHRVQLMTQFITEATLITFTAGLLAIALVVAFLPSFNQLASSNLTWTEIFNPVSSVQMFLFFAAVGVVSGFYPAVVLSGFKPSVVLKGAVQKPSRFNLRQALVVMQFTVSLVLIIGTLVVMRQVDFMQHKDHGFNKDHVLVITDPGIPTAQRFPVIKEKWQNLTSVDYVTSLSHDLGQKNLPFYPIRREGKDEEVMLPVIFVGFDFLETFQISMKQGRFFDANAPGDSTLAFIINESAAKSFGWTDATGKALTFGANPNPNHRVIGIIEDFNFDPLRNSVGPLVIKFGGYFANAAIKLKPGDVVSQVEEIEARWKEVYPDGPFSYYFLDQGISRAYAEEKKLSRIYLLFCGLAIFIACLGLLALAAYSIEKRKREIAIRKVLGAHVSNISWIIYRGFLALIGLGFLLAAPISYFVFNHWLNGFAYRINLEPWIFGVGFLAVAILATISILYQTIKGSLANPATVLKND